MVENRNRVSGGIPAGGQFAPRGHSEASVALAGANRVPDMGTADVEELRSLVEHPDPVVRCELLSSPRVPEDVVERLSEHDQEVFVRLAAVNTGYPGASDRAVNDPNPIVQAAALFSWDVSAADRKRLESDASVQRMMSIISH